MSIPVDLAISVVHDMDLENRVTGFMTGRDLDWKSTSGQKWRKYIFRNGSTKIAQPIRLNEKRSERGFSHRIIDAKGVSHYVPSDWLAVTYDADFDPSVGDDGWSDIKDTLWRTYEFDGHEITISEPSKLLVKRTDFGDVHTIIDEDGYVHEIAAGWMKISWLPRVQDTPTAVG